MPAHVIDSAIFRDMYGTSEMRTVFEDAQLIQRWLDVEAALAQAQARLGIVPADAAAEIAHRARVEAIDLTALREGANLTGYPILPLVRQLTKLCENDLGQYVHWGATTQDIMDTASVLQLRAAVDLLGRELSALDDILAYLAQTHRDTVMAGRTHGQHAVPITFGFKVAVWVDELRRHKERLQQLQPRLLRCSFAGAAGTAASLGMEGWAVHQALAAELELAPAPISWHTARDSFGEYVAWCGLLVATLGKMAREVATLQQTEFAEVEEPFVPGRGGSTTMPQKRNPILCEAVIGIARLVAQQVPAMPAAMQPEHERAMGEWHVEWEVLPHTSILTAAALHHCQVIFDGLVVDADAMQRNLQLTQGNIVAETVMMRLAGHMGRQRAYDLVYKACLAARQEAGSLRAALLAEPAISSLLSADEIDRLLDPAQYVGLAPFFVDQIIGPSAAGGMEAQNHAE